jgi:hypothetical protein
MAKETMTSEERYQAAIRLEKPDRVPVVPLMSTAGAASLVNQDSGALFAGGTKAQVEADLGVFDAFGGWDAASPIAASDAWELMGLRSKFSEGESGELQILETENMQIEDYDLVSEIGWSQFVNDHLVPRISDVKDGEAWGKKAIDILGALIQSVADFKGRGATLSFSSWNFHPFFQLSLVRSMIRFTEDLYYHPEKVDAALKAAVPVFIERAVGFCQATGVMIANCTEERAGGFFYPPKIFERFWWPYTLEIVDALWSQGIVTWFHIDTCWDKNLHYFKQLPRGSAIIDLDGTTDIFKAKEILRDHLCIATDVHPTLLSLGKPQEVEAYCKEVIDRIGGDGGCILTTGCTVPGAVKPENFRAMIETGKNYELGKV